jgi:hypothetical protein
MHPTYRTRAAGKPAQSPIEDGPTEARVEGRHKEQRTWNEETIMGQKNDPHYGEDTDHQPHMGEREEPKGGPDKETGPDKDDTKKSGMRPTGSGGSAPATENM